MLTNIVDRVHYNRILIVTTNKGEVMEQLELPLKFKPNTYESYTDAQKKEYWHTNYTIQSHRIERAHGRLDMFIRRKLSRSDGTWEVLGMLKGLIDEIDLRSDDPERALSDTAVKGRIRKIRNDLIKHHQETISDIKSIRKGLVEEI